MQVFVATRPVDFRKGIDGLALGARNLEVRLIPPAYVKPYDLPEVARAALVGCADQLAALTVQVKSLDR